MCSSTYTTQLTTNARTVSNRYPSDESISSNSLRHTIVRRFYPSIIMFTLRWVNIPTRGNVASVLRSSYGNMYSAKASITVAVPCLICYMRHWTNCNINHIRFHKGREGLENSPHDSSLHPLASLLNMTPRDSYFFFFIIAVWKGV